MHTVTIVSILFLCIYANCDDRINNLDTEFLFLRNAYPFWEPEVDGVKAQVGSPLVITPLIEAGKVVEARKRSVVDPELLDGKTISYSAFLTVDKKYNSNLFFWFFPTASDNPKAPLILWLQGGPGASSLYGLFVENGPFSVRRHSIDNFTLHENPNSWHRNYSMLYVDSPVGTGFSFTNSSEGYATNLSTVVEHLHNAMTQFFIVFPELKQVDFYITGESYAGKYVPALAHIIHTKNKNSKEPINLQGIAVGNGFTDPTSTLAYSEYLYQLGLVDKHVKQQMRDVEDKCRDDIEKGHLMEAFNVLTSLTATIRRTTQFRGLYNFVEPDQGDVDDEPYVSYVQSAPIRIALHVGDVEYNSGDEVYNKMMPDMLNSAKRQLEEVLDAGYRVMFYSGQLDIIVAYPLSVNLYDRLNFTHSEAYNKAPRNPWYTDDGKVAGYVKKAGNFVEVMVRNAGHMVPTDQPEAALQLLRKFTDDEWE